MKRIHYKVMSEINAGTEVTPDIKRIFRTVSVGPMPEEVFQSNYAIAQQVAQGEITVEDIPEPETEPSQEEDTAAMLVDHEFRLTLLELGLSE